MNNENKKQEPNAQSLVSPPSHPTSLGDVWVGTTKPSTSALVEVLGMAKIASDKTRHH